MRPILPLHLISLVAVVAGCRFEAGQSAARSIPQRDLTLVTQTAPVEIASPVEMRLIKHRTVRPSRTTARPARAPRSSPLRPKVVLASVAPAPILAAPEPVAQPNDRELLPGKTVTVIPASTGPSPGSDAADETPGRRGHSCRSRGRGPDIAGVPRPDFR